MADRLVHGGIFELDTNPCENPEPKVDAPKPPVELEGGDEWNLGSTGRSTVPPTEEKKDTCTP